MQTKIKDHERFYLGVKGLMRNNKGEVLLLLKNLQRISYLGLNPDSHTWIFPEAD